MDHKVFKPFKDGQTNSQIQQWKLGLKNVQVVKINESIIFTSSARTRQNSPNNVIVYRLNHFHIYRSESANGTQFKKKRICNMTVGFLCPPDSITMTCLLRRIGATHICTAKRNQISERETLWGAYIIKTVWDLEWVLGEHRRKGGGVSRKLLFGETWSLFRRLKYVG